MNWTKKKKNNKDSNEVDKKQKSEKKLTRNKNKAHE